MKFDNGSCIDTNSIFYRCQFDSVEDAQKCCTAFCHFDGYTPFVWHPDQATTKAATSTELFQIGDTSPTTTFGTTSTFTNMDETGSDTSIPQLIPTVFALAWLIKTINAARK